ncbi:MAG TPA: DUF6489 family protein [Solimonas sp.]|jgi:hypothetical protein|nr:DUF6489 family protein [Solimonas sp.]
MQIKIEIDVRPEELRRFLGLPDVSGLQEDVVAFLRDKLGAASEFDASQFVKSNFETLRKTPAWKRFAARLRVAEDGTITAGSETAAPKKRRTRRTPAKNANDGA